MLVSVTFKSDRFSIAREIRFFSPLTTSASDTEEVECEHDDQRLDAFEGNVRPNGLSSGKEATTWMSGSAVREVSSAAGHISPVRQNKLMIGKNIALTCKA
jgi:hypothetical protein